MIQIDELHISMPGNDKENGTELGRQVAERLATAIPENQGNQHIPEIRVQMQGSSLNDTLLMEDRIVEQIISQIKLTLL